MKNKTEKVNESKYKYIKKYTNENYKTFGAKLKIEEYNEIKKALDKKNITNAEFVRWAYEEFIKE